MAHMLEPSFQQSSPDSSKGGADSYKHEGTPDTRLTAFSPDENSAKASKLPMSGNLTTSELQTSRFPINQVAASFCSSAGVPLEKDPFITPKTTSKSEQKLSATASSFLPFSSPLVARGSGEAGYSPDNKLGLDGRPPALPVSQLLSTELNLSRCLVITSPSDLITLEDVNLYLSKLEQHGFSCQGTETLHLKGPRVYIRFTNLRDACMVHRNIHLGSADWVANFLAPPEFVQIISPGSRMATLYEGQLVLLALFRQSFAVDPTVIETTVRQLVQLEGDVFAFKKETGVNVGTLRATVEFSDTNTALDAMSKYRNGVTIDGVHIILSFHKKETFAGAVDPHDGIMTPIATPLRTPASDMTSAFHSLHLVDSLANTPQSNGSVISPGHHTLSPGGVSIHPPFAMYPFIYRNSCSPTAPVLFDHLALRSHNISPIASSFPLAGPMIRHTPATSPLLSVSNDFGSPRSLQYNNRADARRQNATRVPRAAYYNAAGHHNHVDVNRIREGIDVRTTIMLRNIPNKVDQVMLKAIIDESSWGKYDFMYLRIDFANDCNVGYAFINFVDPLDIIDFVNARGNQRWNCFKSDKVAEISYATIQGKDCLVQKFRNSSVMLEAAHYRPKLYYTSNGPLPELAGQEEPFPDPDNHSKMKRSCENAEHVGLFTPNAGQHFRDEQRRRRSQYDRGTRLAALEEYDYEASIQHMYVS